MTKGEIVKLLTEDGLELQGFFVDSKSKIGFLHIHGLSGNFYENSLIDYIANYVEKKNISFLSLNTRGHDYVNDITKIEGSKYSIVNVGGALERFEDCILDIKIGVDFLKRKGCKKIILQGHSSGCQKITYYYSTTRDTSIAGLILLAPADDRNTAKKMLGKDFVKTLKLAEDMVKNKSSDDFMPTGLAGLPVISAARFVSLCSTSSTEADLFDYNGEMNEISTITLPILAVFGSRDIYLTMSPEKTLGILKSKAGKAECEIAVTKSAPHNFRDYEKQLVQLIDKWLGELLWKKK